MILVGVHVILFQFEFLKFTTEFYNYIRFLWVGFPIHKLPL